MVSTIYTINYGCRHMKKNIKSSLESSTSVGGHFASTRLSDEEYSRCLGLALSYIKEHGSIRNLQLRGVASIGYDQAIHFFSRAVQEGLLSRHGASSATRYLSAR